jgi:ferredoxin
MALGLNNAYVLQSSGSALYQSRESILSGLAGNRPALFNVFSGLAGNPSGPAKNAPHIAPYLRAAAAMESRAFPAFAYDPAAGNDWASRFSIDVNPQAEADWPTHRFCYEDEELQRLTEDIAFTFVDFAASDARYAGRFVGVPRSQWHDGMVPVNQFLELENGAAAGKVPYILMIDEGKFLHRAVVEHNLIHAARRCREMWRSLRELGGFNDSHAGEPAALQPRSEPEAEAPSPSTADQLAPTEIAEAAETHGDEPYVDTARCTTCNECTEINNRMFVYDDNQQAYIADPDAGSYRQLVDAAECCQVAIIHPGRPRNPNEPDLDELISRAEAFN